MASKEYEKKRAGTRTRNWAIIVYPESAPENWREILNELYIQWVESPLHDKDLNADGEPKKAHYHIMLAFPNPVPYERALAVTEALNTVVPQKVTGTKGCIRYMAHIDNPEKHQYNVSEIVGHGGFDVGVMFKATSSDRHEIIGEMMDFVDDNLITSFADLCRFARRNKRDTWFPLLCDNSAIVMKEYVKAVWRELENKRLAKAHELELVRRLNKDE